MEPFISHNTLAKLTRKHGIAASEVFECFSNRAGPPLTDTREDHQTDPPTRWFIAPTDMGKKLKIVYIQSAEGPIVKTAYPPNAIELHIYSTVTGTYF